MRATRMFALACVVALVGAACSSSGSSKPAAGGASTTVTAVKVEPPGTGSCDDTDPTRCLLPFPNDRFTARGPVDADGPPARPPGLGHSCEQGGQTHRPDRMEPQRRLQPVVDRVDGRPAARRRGVEAPAADRHRAIAGARFPGRGRRREHRYASSAWAETDPHRHRSRATSVAHRSRGRSDRGAPHRDRAARSRARRRLEHRAGSRVRAPRRRPDRGAEGVARRARARRHAECEPHAGLVVHRCVRAGSLGAVATHVGGDVGRLGERRAEVRGVVDEGLRFRTRRAGHVRHAATI